MTRVKIGVPGHPRLCECEECLRLRMLNYRKRVKEMRTPLLPIDAHQTIPVRSHFRRGKNHLSKQPKLREMVAKYLAQLKGEGSPV